MRCQSKHLRLHTSTEGSRVKWILHADKRKLVILCLHGYLQNAEMFSAKIGSLRKAMRQRAEFHFIDAPHPVVAEESEAAASGGAREGGRAWWLWQDIEEGMRPSLAASYIGWEESSKVLNDAVKRLRPDGILVFFKQHKRRRLDFLRSVHKAFQALISQFAGFSQGATAAALFLAHVKSDSSPEWLRFAVLVAGFLPRDEKYASLLASSSPDIPVLLIHGENDKLIPEHRSQELQSAIETSNRQLQRFRHQGAHMVPSCSGAFKQMLQQFLDCQRENCIENMSAAP